MNQEILDQIASVLYQLVNGNNFVHADYEDNVDEHIHVNEKAHEEFSKLLKILTENRKE